MSSVPLRPARIQVCKEKLDSYIEERNNDSQITYGADAVLNTWYRKWSGGNQKQRHQVMRAPFRCSIELDSGYTKALSPYICLWFARGACYKGEGCPFLHRAPTEADRLQIDDTTDCFGRTKFADYREDMGGVGSFHNVNRTLFVGYFPTDTPQLLSQLHKQFSEWGEIVDLQLKSNNTIAFVTYKHQLSAEFAKETMANQTITGSETLNIRWSQRASRMENQKATDEDKIRSIVRRVLSEQRKRFRYDNSNERCDDAVTGNDANKSDESKAKRQNVA